MTSKSRTRTLIRSNTDHRGRGHSGDRRKNPTSSILSSIRKTFFTCSCIFVKIFTEFGFTNTSARYQGYRKNNNNRTKRDEKFKFFRATRKTPFIFNVDPALKLPILSSARRSVFEELASTSTPIRPVIRKFLSFNETSKPKLPPLLSSTKRTIFLDLDETLIHSSSDPAPQIYDFIVKPIIEGINMEFYVLKRPGVGTFLTELAEKYEIVIFTAALEEYASLVIDEIDTEGVISHRLYRDSCVKVNGKYVKDLSSTGRELKRAVIIDDNPKCYMYQPNNGLPIRQFIDDLEDEELRKLGSFLQVCDCYEDMRAAVKDYLVE